MHSRAAKHLWAWLLLLRHVLIEVSQVRLLSVLLQTRKTLGKVLGHGHGTGQLHWCLTWKAGSSPVNAPKGSLRMM